MCGIVGLIGSRDASREAFLGLTTLQHRGQDAAGILTYDADGFHRVRNQGLVESVFTRENMATLSGAMAIGHARYSTVGRGDMNEVQPFLIGYPFGIGMVHNGNIVNCDELADELRKKSRRHLLTRSDSEVVLNLFAEGLSRSATVHATEDFSFEHVCEAVGHVFTRAEGSYSILTIIADQGLVAFRDPWGIRPLVLGRKKDDTADGFSYAYMIASESVALGFLGYEPVRDIEPGEVLFIDLKGNVHSRVIRQEVHRPCMFEWVYFASPESVMDGAPVYGARIRLGRNLAKLVATQMKERGLVPDVIVPVPETSRIAAIALAEELGIPYREVLIKNRYIKRTFILDSGEKRQKAVNLKLSPVRSEIEGRKVLLMDDSIVRGTTSKKIIELVRKAGAAEVYFVSTCPPIQNPCFYGIDFPVHSELIASGRSVSEIERELSADAVIYQDIEGLRGAIVEAGGKEFLPCMACLDGSYPTGARAAQRFARSRSADRAGSKGKKGGSA